MQDKAYRHMWAIVPPPALAQEIDALRKELSENFQSKAALKPPVHITLYTLFDLPVAQVEEQMGRLRRWASMQPSFSISLKNFGFFEHAKSPVAYIHVAPNPVLKALNSELSKETKTLFEIVDKSRTTFNPHITIGYRDIAPDVFTEVKKAYSRRLFNATFEVQHICLFRHNFKHWELKHELPLATGAAVQVGLW